MRKILLFAFLLLVFSSAYAFAEVPIEIDLKQGGAITYVGLDGENVVEDSDCGYLIQLALYDESLPRTVAGSSCLSDNPDYNFAWNPVQACDGCQPPHMSQILAGSDKSYIKMRPLLWIGNGQVGDFVIEQRISQTEYSNAVKVNYKIIHEGEDYHEKLALELPATWIKNKYSKFVYYNGNTPWTNGVLKEAISDISAEVLLKTESWGALVDPSSNKGIGVYNPSNLLMMNFIPQPFGATIDTKYFTSWVSTEFPPHSEFSYDFYILTGSVQEIRSTVYKLPRNTNYLVEPVFDLPKTAKKAETLNIPFKITNKTLAAFHKDDNKPNYNKTMIKVKGTTEDWVPIASDVLPGQSITMNLPIKMPGENGKYKFTIDVLNSWWLVQSGFPEYSFSVDVADNIPPPTPDISLKYLGKGWNRVLNKGSQNIPCVVVNCRESRYYRCGQIVNF